MVRPATLDDIPALLAMGKAFHAESLLPCAFDLDAMGAVLRQMIESDGAAVLMTDSGVIGGAMNPAYCDPTWLYAVELFWWAHGDGMKLLRSFERWAQQAGAKEIRMTSLATLPRADRILRCVGYAPAEISYSKVV
jgi:GNAT superfamily N-acetyltransferase